LAGVGYTDHIPVDLVFVSTTKPIRRNWLLHLGLCSSNAAGVYSGSAQFESQPGHWVPRLPGFPQSLQANVS
jgi:hypothetical protein